MGEVPVLVPGDLELVLLALVQASVRAAMWTCAVVMVIAGVRSWLRLRAMDREGN